MLPPPPPQSPSKEGPGTSPQRRGIRRGEWNHNIGFIGIPGCGKTALMARRILELDATTPCYKVVHDAEHTFPRRLPPSLGGWATGVRHHDSVEHARAAMRKDPRGIHAISCPYAEDVMRFAHELGEHSLKGGEGPAPPVVCGVDEITSSKEMGAGWLGPTAQAALTVRRHRHTAILWGIQSASMVNKHYLAMNTELYVFRQNDETDLERLHEKAGLTVAELQLVKHLNPYEYIRKEPVGFKARV